MYLCIICVICAYRSLLLLCLHGIRSLCRSQPAQLSTRCYFSMSIRSCSNPWSCYSSLSTPFPNHFWYRALRFRQDPIWDCDIIWILNLLRWVPVLGFFGLTSTVTRQPSKRPKFSKSLSSPLANSHLVRWSSSWPEQKKYIVSP